MAGQREKRSGWASGSSGIGRRGRRSEIRKLHLLAGKGMALKAIAKAMPRSEELIARPRHGGQAEDRQAALRRGRAVEVRVP